HQPARIHRPQSISMDKNINRCFCLFSARRSFRAFRRRIVASDSTRVQSGPLRLDFPGGSLDGPVRWATRFVSAPLSRGLHAAPPSPVTPIPPRPVKSPVHRAGSPAGNESGACPPNSPDFVGISKTTGMPGRPHRTAYIKTGPEHPENAGPDPPETGQKIVHMRISRVFFGIRPYIWRA